MTCLFALLTYRYFRLNTAFLVGLFLVSVWNGACYYMEVFSKQYEKQLSKLAEEVSSAVAANQLAHDADEDKRHEEEELHKQEREQEEEVVVAEDKKNI